MHLLSRLKIYGHSMEPTIKNGETALTSSLPYLFSKPKINDVIAFKERKSGKVFIKRIAEIDGKRYFVSGDNKRDSLDSRKIGWIKRKEIVGKAIIILNIK